jgi:hypothetical protein
VASITSAARASIHPFRKLTKADRGRRSLSKVFQRIIPAYEASHFADHHKLYLVNEQSRLSSYEVSTTRRISAAVISFASETASRSSIHVGIKRETATAAPSRCQPNLLEVRPVPRLPPDNIILSSDSGGGRRGRGTGNRVYCSEECLHRPFEPSPPHPCSFEK